MTTIELTEETRTASERGGDRGLAVAFFGAVASLYSVIGYVIYLAIA